MVLVFWFLWCDDYFILCLKLWSRIYGVVFFSFLNISLWFLKNSFISYQNDNDLTIWKQNIKITVQILLGVNLKFTSDGSWGVSIFVILKISKHFCENLSSVSSVVKHFHCKIPGHWYSSIRCVLLFCNSGASWWSKILYWKPRVTSCRQSLARFSSSSNISGVKIRTKIKLCLGDRLKLILCFITVQLKLLEKDAMRSHILSPSSA